MRDLDLDSPCFPWESKFCCCATSWRSSDLNLYDLYGNFWFAIYRWTSLGLDCFDNQKNFCQFQVMRDLLGVCSFDHRPLPFSNRLTWFSCSSLCIDVSEVCVSELIWTGMTVVCKWVDLWGDCQCRVFLKSQTKCCVPDGCPLPAWCWEVIAKGLLHCMFQEEVQGLQHMTVCWIPCRSIDLRKNQIPRWFPSVESFPKSESIFSVVGRLMNRTILFCCLQIADNSLVPLVPEPLALDSVHVFCT